MDHELKGREETIIGAEQRLAISMDQISREISRLGRAQHDLFALVDSLAKILLTCIPEPERESDAEAAWSERWLWPRHMSGGAVGGTTAVGKPPPFLALIFLKFRTSKI
jgi:hypothetical protein